MHTPHRLGSAPHGARPAASRSKLAHALRAAVLIASIFASSAQADIVFDNGFEAGTNDWLLTTSPWRDAEANAVSYTTVAREGTGSVRFLPYTGHKRSEFVLRNGLGGWDRRYNWGTEYWIGFSVRVLQPNLGYGIICQHHAVPHTDPITGEPDWNTSAGPNSFTIKTDASGNFVVYTTTNPANVFVVPDKPSAVWGANQVTRPYALNTWYDFVLHFRLATDNTGIMEVWMKNVSSGATEKLVDVQNAPTVYLYDLAGEPKTPFSYQKIGLYYGTGNESIAGDLLYDAFRVWEGSGGQFSSVAPGGAPAPPAGYWRFDEGAGTTATDSSGNGNNGALQNAPTWVSGVVNSGLSFDGVDDAVSVASSASLNNLPALTVAAWIKPNSMGEGGYGRIGNKGTNGTSGWRFHVEGTNQLRFAADYQTDVYRLTAANAIAMGAWNHVAVSWSGSTTATDIRLYVNGVEVGYATTSNGAGARVDDSAGNLTIGNESGGTRTFDGVLDDVRVYNRVLSTNEILAVYRAGL